MPGLRYPRPPTTAPNGSYSVFHDVQNKDETWDPVDINSVYSAAVEAVPFVPSKHKACRPPKFHAAWMKGKAGSATNAFNGLGRTMNMCAPVQSNGGNGGNDSDDLAAMVHDFIESGSPAFLDANDSDLGTTNIVKLRDTLEVHSILQNTFMTWTTTYVLHIMVENLLTLLSRHADRYRSECWSSNSNFQ